MSQALTVQLSEAAYAALQQVALAANVTPADMAATALEREFGGANGARGRACATPEAERQAARQRFERHFGAVEIGHPSGADNEAIDADLAREYANSHEEA